MNAFRLKDQRFFSIKVFLIRESYFYVQDTLSSPLSIQL